MWLNVIFARLWSELRDTEAFSKALRDLIAEELVDLKRDPIGVILGEPSELRLTDIYLGDSAPNLDNVTVLSQKNFPRKKSNEKGAASSAATSGQAASSSSSSSSSSAPTPGASSPFPPAANTASSPTPAPSTSASTPFGAGPSSSTPASTSSSPFTTLHSAASMSSTASVLSTNFSSPSADAAAAAQNAKDESPELTVIFDVTYLGGIAVVAEIPTTLGFFFTVSARLNDLSGRMFVQFQEKPDSTFSFAFYDMPKMKTEFQVLVNGTEFGLLTRLFEKGAHAAFREKLVLPNMKTKWFMNGPEQPPYPWNLKDGEDESLLYSWKSKVEPTSPATLLQEKPSMDHALFTADATSPATTGGGDRLSKSFPHPDTSEDSADPRSGEAASSSVLHDSDTKPLEAMDTPKKRFSGKFDG